MKTKLFGLLALLLMLCTVAMSAKKVHTLGDSTMAPYDESATVTRGWGMYFGNFLANGWTSINYAKGGRDTYTGYSELWQNAKNNVEAGDYVIITFGHNDEKNGGMDGYQLRDYYLNIGDNTAAAAVDLRGSIPSTTYKQNLGKIVDEVLAKGAIPVICSPVCRSYFDNGKIKRNGRHDLGDSFSILTANGPTTGNSVPADDHTMDYAYHSKMLAQEKNVAFIDLTTATKDLYESYGDAKCHEQLFDGDGSTHFNTTGALLVARLCAQLMKEQNILADGITVPTDLSISPATADLGDAYKGQTIVKELTLNGFGLSPADGTIAVTATEGITLSTDKSNWQSSLSIDYKNNTLVQNIYARVILTNAGKFNGTITATLGENKVDVPLTVNVLELGGGDPFTVNWTMNSTDKANATVTGDATATEVKYEGLGTYGYINGFGALIAPNGSTGNWPSAGIDDDPTQYVQFAVTAPEGKKLDITNIAMKIKAQGGGALQCHVYYSTDGFVNRKTIFSSGVLNSTWNEINCEDVVNVDEGERLLIRVYPWSKNVDNGRWICISDVAVNGQSKSAAGITIENAAVNWPFVNEGTDAGYSSTEVGATMAATSFEMGNSLKISGVRNMGGYNCNKVYNQSGASLPGTTTDANTMTFTIRPDDGFTFLPSTISFGAARIGTGGGTLNVSVSVGDNEEVLATNWTPGSYQTAPYYNDFSATISALAATTDKPLIIKIALCSLGNTKEIGFHDIKVTGTVSGAAAQVTKYTLTTNVSPADAGTITIDPEMTSFKEGTQVTLTAKKNFGYKFKMWQDGTGATVSTEATTTVTMNADMTMKAVFETIPVYTVSTKVTNDADRSLGSITLTPNDHAGKYEVGTQITATANESKILKFMSWTDENENAGTAASREITVNSDMTLVANYEVQDFIAVFDASKVNTYAYTTTANYPFPADLTWDDQRNTQAAVVKVNDGSLCYTNDGTTVGTAGTPVVRSRTGAVLSTINGLYQNGYNTKDIAWQYQFSTKGFTTVRFEGDMAAKNGATKNWKVLVSTDGTNFEPIGDSWEVTANVVKPIAFDLPATAAGKDAVYLRITGTGDEVYNSTYTFDKTFDGLKYCDHSESGVGNVYILGTSEVAEDAEPPVVTSMIPADGATGVSATGRITISFNERIKAVENAGKATLNDNELTAQWSSRSVSFDYFNLNYGQNYTFSMPAGFVQDNSGNKAAAVQLTFTVMERQQPTARTFDAIVDQSLEVAKIDATADMPAQYKKIQDAINDAPSTNSKPYLIYIKEGYYNDPNETFDVGMRGYRYANPADDKDNTTINDVPSKKNQYDDCRLVYVNKPNIHLIGQAVDKVTIAGDRLDGGAKQDRTRVWYHVSAGATLEVQAGGKDFYMENITVDNENWTKQKWEGPQALCMNISADRAVFNNVNVRSYQDTYYAGGDVYNRQYWQNSTLEGGVDYIYGNGCDVFFESCIQNINRKTGGYIVAPSHPANTRWGYVFNNNIITSTYFTPEEGKVYLGRPWHENPKTVFLHTQMEVGAYEGYWYETMGGIPALWAVYDIWDKNGNKMSNNSIEDYWYLDANDQKVTGKAKNALTDEEAAQYTLANVMAGDGTGNAETGVWNPLPIVEKTATPVLTAINGGVTWDAVPYAICYVVTVNDKPVAFPTDTKIIGLKKDDVVSVQAVNEYGALSEMSAAVTISNATGIQTISNGTSAMEAVYSLDGKRLQHMQRGLNIVKMSDGRMVKMIYK